MLKTTYKMIVEPGCKYKSKYGEPLYMYRPEEIAFRKEALFAWKQKRASNVHIERDIKLLPTLHRIPASPPIQGIKIEECSTFAKSSHQGDDTFDITEAAKLSSPTTSVTKILETEPSGPPPAVRKSFPSKR